MDISGSHTLRKVHSEDMDSFGPAARGDFTQ